MVIDLPIMTFFSILTPKDSTFAISFATTSSFGSLMKPEEARVLRDLMTDVVEQGTHEDLLRAKGYYHDLYSKQFAEENAAKILGA